MSGVDRLAELRRGAKYDDDNDDDEERQSTLDKDTTAEGKSKTSGGGKKSSQGEADIEQHMARYDLIKRGLDVLSKNTQQVDKLRQKNIKAAHEKQRKAIMTELDSLMDQSKQHAQLIKKTLDDIKAENAAYAKQHKQSGSSAKVQMRANLYATHIRRFHTVMNDYNAAADSFKKELRARTRREIKIVDSTLGDEQVEAIVESGKAQDVIKQALISDNLQDVVRTIEERHLDILRLEQQVI
jgi:t-SNARE complex subunit (syntaxin)